MKGRIYAEVREAATRAQAGLIDYITGSLEGEIIYRIYDILMPME